MLEVSILDEGFFSLGVSVSSFSGVPGSLSCIYVNIMTINFIIVNIIIPRQYSVYLFVPLTDRGITIDALLLLIGADCFLEIGAVCFASSREIPKVQCFKVHLYHVQQRKNKLCYRLNPFFQTWLIYFCLSTAWPIQNVAM